MGLHLLLPLCSIACLLQETYLEPSRTSTMKHKKRSIVDVWLGSKCASDYNTKISC